MANALDWLEARLLEKRRHKAAIQGKSPELESTEAAKREAFLIAVSLIVFIPIVGAWFTLSERFSRRARAVSFAWAAVFGLALIVWDHDTGRTNQGPQMAAAPIAGASAHLPPPATVVAPVSVAPSCVPESQEDTYQTVEGGRRVDSRLHYGCIASAEEIATTMREVFARKRAEGAAHVQVLALLSPALAERSGISADKVIGRVPCVMPGLRVDCRVGNAMRGASDVWVSAPVLDALSRIASVESEPLPSFSREEKRLRDFWWEYTSADNAANVEGVRRMPNCCASVEETERQIALIDRLSRDYTAKVLKKYGLTTSRVEEIEGRAFAEHWADGGSTIPRDVQERGKCGSGGPPCGGMPR